MSPQHSERVRDIKSLLGLCGEACYDYLAQYVHDVTPKQGYTALVVGMLARTWGVTQTVRVKIVRVRMHLQHALRSLIIAKYQDAMKCTFIFVSLHVQNNWTDQTFTPKLGNIPTTDRT